METIKNALGMGTSNNEEPVSGRTGNTAAGEPYDAGNISSTNTQRVGGSDLGSSHVGAVSQSQGAMGGTGDARGNARGGDNSSSHVGAISSSSGFGSESHNRGTGDASRTAPGGDNSQSHIGAISSSSGSGLAQPSERDAARAAGTDRMNSGPTDTQRSEAGQTQSYSGSSEHHHHHHHTGTSHTGTSSNIGPIGDNRTGSGSTGYTDSYDNSRSGGIGPISDSRNTSSNIGSGVSGGNYSSGVIPGTSGAAIGSSSGFLPIRSGENPSVLGDDHGMSRTSEPTTGIHTAQREGGFSSGTSTIGSGNTSGYDSYDSGARSGISSQQTGYDSYNSGAQSGYSQQTGSNTGYTESNTRQTGTNVGPDTRSNTGAVSQTSQTGAGAHGQDESELQRGDMSSREGAGEGQNAGHDKSHLERTGDKGNLEESKKHASPAVAQILEEADHKVKEKNMRKLGPNESSDPEAAKEFQEEATHQEVHKAGMADKIKGALHMGGKH